MIEFGPGVAQSIADDARASLDAQVRTLRAAGKLDAGTSTVAKLQWTAEVARAGQEFQKVRFVRPIHGRNLD